MPKSVIEVSTKLKMSLKALWDMQIVQPAMHGYFTVGHY